MLALLDDHHRRAARHDPPRRLHEIRAVRELARFTVIQRDEVDFLDQRQQVGAAALDPEVHRIAGDELRSLDLAQYVELEPRIDVRQEDEGRTAELRRNLRAEMREDAEMRFQRLGRIEIVAVAAAPAERVARRLLQSRHVHAARTQRLELLHRVVVADDTHELHR